MKIAPEHTEEDVLHLMGKPGKASLLQFKKEFDALSKKSGKNQFLTYYLMAAHPGCTENHMRRLKRFTREKLKTNPRQVQIFTPTPSTYASLMYHTGLNPFTGEKISVEKSFKGREAQKRIFMEKIEVIKRLRKPDPGGATIVYYALIKGPIYGDLPFEAREKIREDLRERLEARGIRFLEYHWIWDEDDRCLLLAGKYEQLESAKWWIRALESMGFTVCVKTRLPGEGT